MSGTNGTDRWQKERWADPFLEQLRLCGAVAKAARAANVPRRTVYNLRERDAGFKEAMDEASIAMVEDAESELFERAIDKDTTALIFFLKTRKPEVYGDKLRADQIEQIRREARQQVLAEMQSEIRELTPAARELLLAAIPQS
jgi:hypothetical protein